MSTIWKKLLLAVVALVVSVLLVEYVLSKTYQRRYMFGPWELGYVYESDDRLMYGLKKEYRGRFETDEFIENTKTDDFGFRGRHDDKYAKPKNERRIVVIGDSFTYGHGLSEGETYPDRLEQVLSLRKSPSSQMTEVLNASVPGYTPDQEYRLLMERAPLASTNVIVWNVSSYDIFDLMSPQPALYGIGKTGQLIPYDARYNWLYIRNYLYLHLPDYLRHSYILDLFMSKLSSIRILGRKPDLPWEQLREWAWRKFTLESESAGRLAKSLGIRLLIVRLPVKDEFNPASQLPKEKYDAGFLRFGQRMKEQSIDFFDMKNELAAQSTGSAEMISRRFPDLEASVAAKIRSPETLFFPKDGHPNPHGARVFAAMVARYLEDNAGK